MDPQTTDPHKRDLFLRELERRSLDTLMVKNPSSEDFKLIWFKTVHTIPGRSKDMGYGNGKMELPRYLAEKYARDMKNKMVNEMNDKFYEDLVKEYEGKNMAFKDPYDKNITGLAKEPRTSDKKLIDKIYPTLVLGVVREFGYDTTMDDIAGMDVQTVEEQALVSMNKPYDPLAEELEQPVIKKKVDLLKDVRA